MDTSKKQWSETLGKDMHLLLVGCNFKKILQTMLRTAYGHTRHEIIRLEAGIYTQDE